MVDYQHSIMSGVYRSRLSADGAILGSAGASPAVVGALADNKYSINLNIARRGACAAHVAKHLH